jgi:hypothetical protein
MDNQKRIMAIQERLMDALDLKYKNAFSEALGAMMEEDDKLLDSIDQSIAGFRYTGEWRVGDIVEVHKGMFLGQVRMCNPDRSVIERNNNRAMRYGRIKELYSKANPNNDLSESPIVRVSYEYYGNHAKLEHKSVDLKRGEFSVTTALKELLPLTSANFLDLTMEV